MALRTRWQPLGDICAKHLCIHIFDVSCHVRLQAAIIQVFNDSSMKNPAPHKECIHKCQDIHQT